MEVTKNNIIYLFQRDSDDAYKYLYANFYRALVNFAFSYIEDTEAAQDIVQDIYISLLKVDKKKFDALDELKSYLYKSVKNKAISYIRHNNIIGKYSVKVQSEYDDTRFFAENVLEEDIYSILLTAIETLPPRCGSVMKLSLEGYKITEIAQQLLISEDTVKEHKGVAKSRLKVILKKMDLSFIMLFLQ